MSYLEDKNKKMMGAMFNLNSTTSTVTVKKKTTQGKRKTSTSDQLKPKRKAKNELQAGLNMTFDGLKTKLTNKQKMELIGIAAKYVDD